MRRTLTLYSPSIVLFAWAVAWAAGATTDGVMVAALLLEAVAIYLHVKEQLRRYLDGDPRSEPQPRLRRHEDRRRSYRDFWLLAISAVLLWQAVQTQQAADDNHRAITQGCHLTTARVKDNMVQLEQAVDYLKNPKNAKENPGLVRTIRTVSIPFRIRQIQVDRRNFPSSCGTPPVLPKKLIPVFYGPRH